MESQEPIPYGSGQDPHASAARASRPAISIRGLTKRYGPLTALNDLNLDIERGEILGFIIALLALTITLATLPASEIETGFADLILARPLPRHWLITRTIALVLVSILLMLLMIMAGAWTGLVMFAPPDVAWPSARVTGSLALYLGLLLLCWSGVAMALGAGCRRGVAGATMSLLAFAALLLDWAQRLWPALERIGWLSPFSYFKPYELVAGKPLLMENLLVLWAIAMTGFVVAYFVVSQRDISR